VEAEKAREVERLSERLAREESVDLEAAEFFARSLLLGAGARGLERFLAERLREEEAPVCAAKHLARKMLLQDRRAKTLRTILGEVRLVRGRWVCPECGAVRYPADERLGVQHTGFSPGARRMMARTGANESFAEAAADLALLADLRVDAKDVERVAEATGQRVERWMAHEGAMARLMPPTKDKPDTLYIGLDGTGVPMRPEELTESRGKGPDGKARTREVKVGCVFAQSACDEEGNPVRQADSTTYVGAIEPSVEFGHRLHAEAVRRGHLSAQRVVVLSDGAAYNKTIVAEHFPTALHILDIRHAEEHLAEFLRDTCRLPLEAKLHKCLRHLLHEGRIPPLLKRMQSALPHSGPRRDAGQKTIAYLRDNAHAMRYHQYRAMGLFVGSGVVEAACRTIVGQRLKHSGMFWTARGANAIIALRCCYASGRFEQFWEDAA